MSEKESLLCRFCEKKFSTVPSFRGHFGHCENYRSYLKETLTKELLEQLYIIEGRSGVEISEILGLDSFAPIYQAMKKFGISRRSMKEANSCERSHQRRTETNIKRYGLPHNFCKDSPSRKKWEARLLQEEGITNVFQRKEVIRKIQETIATRYPDEDPRTRPVRGRRWYSALHKKVVEIIESLGYQPRIERKFFNFQDRHRILYSFDIFVEPIYLIEVNGDLWHGNPKFYKPNDLIPSWDGGYFPVRKKWAADLEKIRFAEERGFRVMIIWEDELKHDEPAVLLRLKTFLAEAERNEAGSNQEDHKARSSE